MRQPIENWVCNFYLHLTIYKFSGFSLNLTHEQEKWHYKTEWKHGIVYGPFYFSFNSKKNIYLCAENHHILQNNNHLNDEKSIETIVILFHLSCTSGCLWFKLVKRVPFSFTLCAIWYQIWSILHMKAEKLNGSIRWRRFRKGKTSNEIILNGFLAKIQRSRIAEEYEKKKRIDNGHTMQYQWLETFAAYSFVVDAFNMRPKTHKMC